MEDFTEEFLAFESFVLFSFQISTKKSLFTGCFYNSEYSIPLACKLGIDNISGAVTNDYGALFFNPGKMEFTAFMAIINFAAETFGSAVHDCLKRFFMY